MLSGAATGPLSEHWSFVFRNSDFPWSFVIRNSLAKPAVNTRSDIVCPFCSCACDDLAVTIENGRIVDVVGGCEQGRSRFLDHDRETGPTCLIDGQPASFDAAIDRAVELLRAAHAPLIYGLSEATAEAQSLAATIAARARAVIDTPHSRHCPARGTPLQTVGISTCTLGELRDRADVIVCWGVDYRSTHQGFFERYVRNEATTSSVGNTPSGIPRVVVVSDQPAISNNSDAWLQINPGSAFEAAWVLRALVQEASLPDGVEVERQTGVALTGWQALAAELKQAKYGVMLLDTPSEFGLADDCNSYHHHAIHALTIDLCEFTRFSCITLSQPGNLTAADAVLTWRTGYPFAVDLSEGFPRFGPREFTARRLIARDECDLILTIGQSDAWLPRDTSALAIRCKTIRIGEQPCELSASSTVVIRTARFGIDSPGTYFRLDGVPLPLRQLVASQYPTLDIVLAAIDARLCEAGLGA